MKERDWNCVCVCVCVYVNLLNNKTFSNPYLFNFLMYFFILNFLCISLFWNLCISLFWISYVFLYFEFLMYFFILKFMYFFILNFLCISLFWISYVFLYFIFLCFSLFCFKACFLIFKMAVLKRVKHRVLNAPTLAKVHWPLTFNLGQTFPQNLIMSSMQMHDRWWTNYVLWIIKIVLKVLTISLNEILKYHAYNT